MSDRTPSSRTEKQAHILAAAHQLFLANGYKRTSMEAIRALAGVSKPTLYAYYVDKEALFADVIRSTFERVALDHFPSVSHISTTTELRQALVIFAHQVMHNMMTSGQLALLRNIIAELPHFPHLGDIFRQNGPARGIALATQLFTQLHHQGVISVHNAELSARMFIGPLLTYMFTDGLLQVGEPRVPERAIVEQHVDLFLKTVTP